MRSTRVLWWQVDYMFARPLFTNQVVARRIHTANWRWARRGTYKRMRREINVRSR